LVDSLSRVTFSIVTVVKNAENLISATLDSVLAQSYKNYELILIDGDSDDATLQRAKELLSSSNIKSAVISEPDTGIYDAMNKGVKLSSGQYIIFINAGDFLYSNHTLGKIAKHIAQNPSYDIFYGDSIVKYKSFQKPLKAGGLESIKFGMQFSHQSTIVNNELLKNFPFNLKFRIASDYDFLLLLYRKNYRFFYMNFPVSITLSGGISDSRRFDTYKEYLNIVNMHEFSPIPSLYICLQIAINFLKYPIKKIIRSIAHD
jgi:glycosyltransferase involved in cell wall biosynthesis